MLCVVVLNYNDWENTKTFVTSIKDFDAVGKIIVVDNCSTDNSFQKLSELADEKVDIIISDKNGGYAYGNNFGATYALKLYQPEYLVISNPDIQIEESTIVKLQSFLQAHNDAAIVSAKMVCLSNIRLPIAWKMPTFWDCLLENLMILRKLVGDKTQYSPDYFSGDAVPVDVLPGSFLMLSAKAFEQVGGFDEETFLYYEENILSRKLMDKGYVNYLMCQEQYLHMHSVSINKSISSVKNRLKIAYTSREIYCQKYLGIGRFQSWLLKATFRIGLFNYLLANRLLGRVR